MSTARCIVVPLSPLALLLMTGCGIAIRRVDTLVPASREGRMSGLTIKVTNDPEMRIPLPAPVVLCLNIEMPPYYTCILFSTEDRRIKAVKVEGVSVRSIARSWGQDLDSSLFGQWIDPWSNPWAAGKTGSHGALLVRPAWWDPGRFRRETLTMTITYDVRIDSEERRYVEIVSFNRCVRWGLEPFVLRY